MSHSGKIYFAKVQSSMGFKIKLSLNTILQKISILAASKAYNEVPAVNWGVFFNVKGCVWENDQTKCSKRIDL